MQLDMFGKTRYKVNLHMHTTLSDGQLTPAEAVQRYRNAGYDAVALTDHWFFGHGGEEDGFTVLPGVEYDCGTGNACRGVYHIVGIGMRYEPSVKKGMSAQGIIDAIKKAGGLAVLAHPAWSLNTPEQILPLKHVDATEIYNTVSGKHMSRRPDASLIVDMLGCRGRYYPLLATDDAHYYDGDECASWIMVEAADVSPEFLIPAIRAGRFYATQGPEVHLLQQEDGSFAVRCSPCREIVLYSNLAWTTRVFTGEGITEAVYTPRSSEAFLRAEVVDENGLRAWSNIVVLGEKK
ncbi:MAG: hypothetical protein IKC31_03475 [Clostridia bacterium]|nr:hypothetical protein [Clostridia bacterium]